LKTKKKHVLYCCKLKGSDLGPYSQHFIFSVTYKVAQ
jgi:hypothetical protein